MNDPRCTVAKQLPAVLGYLIPRVYDDRSRVFHCKVGKVVMRHLVKDGNNNTLILPQDTRTRVP